MPETKEVNRPTLSPEQIGKLIVSIEDPHDLCPMSIGLFCATRTSETLGLQWRSYGGDKLTPAKGCSAFDGMSNVLSEQAKQQVIALGRLGWSLRRIQQETGVRRETASVYLKAAGIPIPPPGRRKQPQAAKPAIPVTTDSEPAKPAICKLAIDSDPARAANQVTTGSGVISRSNPSPSASA